MSIFSKQRLTPSQLRTVADRRFADALFLLGSNQNKHANGAMYLGGFVIECLLKAKLVEKYRWLQAPVDLAICTDDQREIFGLCYRSHDLRDILERLPEIERKLDEVVTGSPRLTGKMRKICGLWSVYARYSPLMADIDDASNFLQDVGELRPWLK